MNYNHFLKPYTVHYRDFKNLRLENCYYALDAYEARTLAMEFNKYIHDHPNSIDLIRCERWYWINRYLKVDFYTLKNLSITVWLNSLVQPLATIPPLCIA